VTNRKSKVKAISLKAEIADKVDLYAKKENRTVSNFVETVLIDYFSNNPLPNQK